MTQTTRIPTFVSVIAFALGSLDLIRGFMHTFKLEYAALYVAKLNLSTPEAPDLLQLLGAFGVSNYITGVMLILVALWARKLALVMLLIIPLAYIVGGVEITHNSSIYPASQAAWGGRDFMIAYLTISALTFVSGVMCTLHRRKSIQLPSSHSQRA